MKPIEFPGQNVIFAKDQPEYQPLPAIRLQDGTVISCWQFTDDEIEAVLKTKCLFLKQLTFNQPLQPILPMVDLAEDIQLFSE